MSIFAILLLVLAAVGLVYVVATAAMVAAYARRPSPVAPTEWPAVTILKPLHGLEPQLAENLATFCNQDYPGPVQIVFGVASAADPARAIAERLRAAYPGVAIDLVVDPRRHGRNAKVSNLINMLPAARHGILILADADIAAPPDHLRRHVAALGEAGVVASTSLYGGNGIGTVWSDLTALQIDSHFLPGVVAGVTLGLTRPCFGSTIAIRREALIPLKNFHALADDLADDYALGAKLRLAALRAGIAHPVVAIPPAAVAHTCTELSFGDLWRHEVRWMRTVRAVDSLGYAGLLLTQPFPLALLALVFGGGWLAAVLAVLALFGRFRLCRAVERAFGTQRAAPWLIPLRELISFGVFVRASFGGTVHWRDDLHGVRRDGTLTVSGDRASP